MNAVVNRDDRPAAHRRRQDVVRRMKHVRLLAAQRPRHVNLLANRIVGRWFEDGPEVRAELIRYAKVGLLAEQDVLVVTIDPRKVPQQVADVGADAEVMELSRIDRDSHLPMIQAAPSAPSRPTPFDTAGASPA